MITRKETIELFERNGDHGWINLVEMIFDGKPNEIELIEVWEKYAELNVSFKGKDKVFSELVDKIRFISTKTCQRCGRSGRKTTVGVWETILCDYHFNSIAEEDKFADEWFYPEDKSRANKRLAHIALLVNDYDEAIDYYLNKLNFFKVQDEKLSETKRWVLITPYYHHLTTRILLVKASSEDEMARVGSQTAGKVGFFLYTDNVDLYIEQLKENGVKIVQQPLDQPWGKVAVISDLYGNLWDIIEGNYSW